MVRRLQVIEKIAGAAENDFYIEMLKTATGEVRLELIEALRFEPSNTELSFDLQKKEKGKNKQAVQNMLALVEDERCYELFHAIAVKKPLEACEYLFTSTTDSASRVIAELFKQQFTDIVALAQSEWDSAEMDKKMEMLCRIIDDLKKMALELYEDSTNNNKNINLECSHGYDHKSCKMIFHTVQIPHAKKITDWMMRHNGKQTDAIINRWIDTTDAEECEKYGRYFYDRASRIVHNEEYLRYMRNCGWKQCKGLGTDYAKINVRREDNQWRLNEYLHNMPGDAQALLEETSAVADLVRSGEVELQDLREPEDIENWANHLKDLKVYNALRDDR